jgi:energy-coupling factor transporter ATP-binding protein EcfA2
VKLRRARVRGFQSFSDSGVIQFSDGINLIIGQNNAGKSAFLRALLPVLPDDRHRTPEKWETFRLALPEIDLTIEASGAEIRDWVLRSGAEQFVPAPIINPHTIFDFMQHFFGRPNFSISVTRRPNVGFSSDYPTHRLFSLAESENRRLSASVTPNNGELMIGLRSDGRDTLPTLIDAAWQREMFYFASERMTIGKAPHGYADRLLANASNLPNVLQTLGSERGDVFQRLVDHLREVFPTVANLSVRTEPQQNQLEVRVWPTERMERVELSFPLNSSGTGVSQVIAMLAAIMTIEHAIIIIDEINSFLHPAAVKALLRILQTQYTQHQYIITTHAPEVISFSNPKTIHLVKRVGYESSIEALDLTKVGKFREVAEHLGVSMADVFAAERIIWVEGPTEELCFPYLHQKLIGPLPRGTIITSVAATGDFNTKKRDPAIVYEVYARLSAAAATLVVSVAFSFDTERLTDADKADMQRRSGGLLTFLPRRHLECFLVDPAAIAAFIISKDPVSAGTVTPTLVEDALRNAAATPQLEIPEWNGDTTDVSWLARVDAANLIENVCGSLSEYRAPFAKKEDSLFLMRHMIDHAATRLKPLCDYVASLVASVAR